MAYAHVTLVAALDSANDLATFSRAFFRALDITDYEERESSNYACGSYFLGQQGPIEISIMESGDMQPEVLPFWVEISSSADEAKLDALVDQQIYNRLLPARFVITRIVDLGKPSEHRANYGAQGIR